MANNPYLDKLINTLQDLRGHTTNLNKDLDEKDQREETAPDLTQLFKSFQELRTTLSKLQQSDIIKLQDELRQLMRGEENLLEYQRDATNILMEVKKRTEKEAQIKDKVTDNLPPQQKNENVINVFNNWQSILTNVKHWIEDNTAAPTR